MGGTTGVVGSQGLVPVRCVVRNECWRGGLWSVKTAVFRTFPHAQVIKKFIKNK